MKGETFFTSIGCIDGRALKAVREFIYSRFGAEYIDAITDDGLVGKLSKDPSDDYLDNIKRKVLISLEKHHSKGIVVHGHQDCAANPINDEEHIRQAIKSTQFIESFIPTSTEVISAFVTNKDGIWRVEIIT